jgi:hypothetical protein
MSRLREYLLRAADGLGLRVETEHTITLPSGTRLEAEAFFPDLGTPAGMAVIRSDLVGSETIAELLFEMRYPASFIGEPSPAEKFDIDSYAEMFTEWGWCGTTATRPPWMPGGDARTRE